ncbi:MAG: carboxypeptidase-like regulatory domain-containing protein [Myxococcales bacterium]|nr:carboxypeptidase-like regulatory domain-containing protein [Myxococcales bacterium]
MDRSDLELAFRCDVEWSSLAGTGKKRHCARCSEQVVDLSAHSEWRARTRLTLQPRTCVRYTLQPDGRVRFRPSRIARLATTLLALWPAMAGAQEHEREPPPAATIRAAEAPQTTALRVTVVDTDLELPIPGAVVEVLGQDVELQSDADGVIEVDVPEGQYALSVTREGFGSVTVHDLRVQAGRTTPLTVKMSAESTEEMGIMVGRRSPPAHWERLRLRHWFGR